MVEINMSDQQNVNAPEILDLFSKFDHSLDALQTAVESKLDGEKQAKNSAREVQRMGADRTRLAQALDEAEARCQGLEAINREVSNRLVNAMETIRSVLDKPNE